MSGGSLNSDLTAGLWLTIVALMSVKKGYRAIHRPERTEFERWHLSKQTALHATT